MVQIAARQLPLKTTFLYDYVIRVQGAFLCHIRPEFLLDIQEFKHWCSLQVHIFMRTQQSGLDLHNVN